MCNVVTCYRTNDGLVEKYSWDPNRKVTPGLLKKSGFERLEIWVPEEEAEMMVSKGWKVAKRLDGSEIVSSKGNVLLTFPERPRLKSFPY